LIKGSIDQVTRVVSITWVQPRVLNKDQITGLRNRLVDWINDVENVGKLIGGSISLTVALTMGDLANHSIHRCSGVSSHTVLVLEKRL
jgi:hypothetical protein